MLDGFGENPPPASVENELQNASNNGMPASFSKIISRVVKKMYIAQTALAVCLILGVILSSVGPGASAKNICLPATANCGNTAINSTIIPIPPSHWLIERQKSIAFG